MNLYEITDTKTGKVIEPVIALQKGLTVSRTWYKMLITEDIL